MTELRDQTHEQIVRLTADGDRLANADKFEKAIARYTEAWLLLPEPRYQWEAATWILAALGDANYFAGNFPNATKMFEAALKCPGGIGNPFVHLRLGEAHF